jgi:deoxyribonuclease-4
MKYGLKIWSIDKKELFKEAVELFKRKQIDFVELYIVPDSLLPGKSEILDDLRNIPTVVHATHNEHGFDVFGLDDPNIKLFKNQIIKIADFLGSKFIVVHSGVGESQKIFEENISKIKDKRIIIENMPKAGLNGELCFGYSLEQLKFIKGCGFNICLDFVHAIKSAISQKLDYKEFVKKLIFELEPSYFHITNAKMDNDKDDHMNLFDGEIDIKWIKETLLGLERNKDICLVFETPKEGVGLENDVKNINYFNSL